MAKPGTGTSETGEPSILPEVGCSGDGAAEPGDAEVDVGSGVGTMDLGISVGGPLVGEDVSTSAGVDLDAPKAWVWL